MPLNLLGKAGRIFCSCVLTCALAACGGDDGAPPSGSSTAVDSSAHFLLGGTISGLTSSGLVLADGAVTISVPANSSSFSFGAIVAPAGSYTVSVLTQPHGQTCSVTNGQGTASGNVTSASVACSVIGPVVHFGITVPAAATANVSAIVTPTDSVAIGSIVPFTNDGSLPLVVAINAQEKPLLLSLGSADGALDSNTTALALVRVALNLPLLPIGLSNSQLNGVTQASPAFPVLLAAISGSLLSGTSPTESEEVLTAVWQVAKDVLIAFHGTLSADGQRLQAALQPASTPLPFYLIQNAEPFNRFYIENVNGGNDINAFDETFIAWEVSTTDPFGHQIIQRTTPLVTPPLSTTALQLLGYYGASASITLVSGSAPAFNLRLTQGTTSKTQNVLSAIVKYVFFIYTNAARLFPNQPTNTCALSIAQTVLHSNFPALVTQPSGDSARAYLENGLLVSNSGGSLYEQFASCGQLPTVPQLTGRVFGGIWIRINLVRSLLYTFGTAAETFNYWDYEQTFQVCKSNGQVVNCPVFVDAVKRINGEQVEFYLKFANTTPRLPITLCKGATQMGGLPFLPPPTEPLCYQVTLDISDQPASDQELLDIIFTPGSATGIATLSATYTITFPNGISTTHIVSYP